MTTQNNTANQVNNDNDKLKKLENVYFYADRLLFFLSFHGLVDSSDDVALELLNAVGEVDELCPKNHDLFGVTDKLVCKKVCDKE